MTFFQRGLPMVLVQKWPFFKLFFLGNIGQENFFYDDILKRKNAFLGYKNKKSKKSKNWHFFKRVNPWFCFKLAIFLVCFFGNIGQEKVLNDILQRKNAFLGYKNKKLKSRKIEIFATGSTHGFEPIFQYIPRKCLLRYSTTKKRLSTL